VILKLVIHDFFKYFRKGKQYHLEDVILQLWDPKKKPEKAYTWVHYVLGLLVSRILTMA
jgi:hypothetical protein